MTKSRIAVGLVGGTTAALTACTTLLGDFQTGPAGGSDGGSGSSSSLALADASTLDGTMKGDEPSPMDGGTPDATMDAADATPALALLTCTPSAGSVVVNLATINRSSSNDQNTVRIFNVGSPNQTTYRAIVPDPVTTGPTLYHTFSFGDGNSQVSDSPIPEQGNVLALARYPGGIAALVTENLNDAGSSTPVLDVYTIADSASAWTGPVVLINGAPLQTCINRMSGALWVLDATSQNYLYDFAYQTCGNPPTTMHLAGQTTSPAAMWPMPLENMLEADGGDAGVTVDAAAGFNFGGIAAAMPATSGGPAPVYSLANAGSNGPAPGIGSTLFRSTIQDLGSVSEVELPLANPAYLMQTLSIQTLASSGDIGLVFLEANLTVQNVVPLFYVGTVTPSQMASLDPSADLPVTTLSGISDIPINSAAYHWESFAAPAAPVPSDNLLAVGPVLTTAAGLNFLWWDSSGALRARNTSSTALFADAGPIIAGDMTFNSAPFPALGQFEVIYTVPQGDSSTLTDVYATQVTCSSN